MATATQERPTTRQDARRVRATSEIAAITFVVLEDNAGDYRWSIRDSRGECLAQSRTFATYDAARQGAAVMRDMAGSARLEPRLDHPVDVARGEATRSRDDSDAERWLDEGGSVDSEAMTRWPGKR